MQREALVDRERSEGTAAEIGRAIAAAIAHRPAAFVIGLVALGVVAYGSINALALQEGEHPAAWFATRADDGTPMRAEAPARQVDDGAVTRIVFDDDAESHFERPRTPATVEEATPPVPVERVALTEPDAQPPLVELQSMLADLGFYTGTIDGISGPMTLDAIDRYKVSVGLRGIDLTTDELLTSLRNNTMVTAAIPTPRPRAETEIAPPPPPPPPQVQPEPVSVPQEAPLPAPAVETPAPDRAVLKVQAGLKAFGNTAITIDGVPGDRTRAAIREFQALFRLPVTGEIDAELIEKMTAIGLID